MPRYAALIRGVNVGRNKKLVMAEFRELLSTLGHTEVRTHLNSGNAVFSSGGKDTAELAREIEHGMAEQLGLTIRCLVRSSAEMQTVIKGNPLKTDATNGSKMLVHFLSAAPDPALLATHDPRELDPNTVALGERVIYQWCPDGVLQAVPAGGFAEKHLHVTVTARNWNTVSKLGALLEE